METSVMVGLGDAKSMYRFQEISKFEGGLEKGASKPGKKHNIIRVQRRGTFAITRESGTSLGVGAPSLCTVRRRNEFAFRQMGKKEKTRF